METKMILHLLHDTRSRFMSERKEIQQRVYIKTFKRTQSGTIVEQQANGPSPTF